MIEVAESLHRRIAEVLLAYPDDEMYSRVLDIVREAVASPYGIFAYLDEDGAAVAPTLTPDVWPERSVSGKAIRFPRATCGNALPSRALRGKKSLYANAPGRVPEGHAPIRRALVVPIILGSEVVGQFVVANKPADYDDRDVALLEGIAAYIAPILHARLQRDAQERLRREAERELESTSKFALENPSPVLRVTAAGVISFANPSSAPLLAHWGRAVGQKVPDEWQTWIGEVLKTGVNREIDLAAGARVYSCALAAIANMPYVNLYGRDVTARRQAERSLRESEARYRALVENVQVGITLIDAEHNILMTNAAHGRMFHKLPAEFVGQKCFRAFAKREAVCAHCPGTRAMATGLPHEVETAGIRDDGSDFPVRVQAFPLYAADGSVTGFIEFVEDIAERKRADDALRQSQAMLAQTEKIANVGSWEWVIETGELRWSEQMYRLFGVEPSGFVPSYASFLAQIHPEDRERVRAATKDELAGRKPLDIECRIVRPDSSTCWLHARGEVSFDEHGRPVRMNGSALDITTRKQAEAELQRLNEELERRVRERTAELEAANKDLEAFNYTVSHDLRAPLRHVSGFTDVLCSDYAAALDENGRRYLRIVAESAQRMSQLIEDLLTFSRAGRAELHKSTVSLVQLVREAQTELEDEVAGRQIDWQIDPLPEVDVDRPMLRQVFINLLSNALKFTRSRPVAKIEIRNASARDGEAVVQVRDNGVGFDMHYVNRLFNVFQRLHPTDEYEGTGIGLAQVHRIVQRHGGRTWAEGAPNQGAAFYFSLPKLREDRM
jgi:PAS domain S-box-containing protein